jgi:hypothetical protein
MIIVRLIGGLGNQLFQYALARRLSVRRGLPIKLDVSGYTGRLDPHDPWPRTCDIVRFRIVAEVATAAEVVRVMRRGWPAPADKLFDCLEAFRAYHRRRRLVEPESLRFTFDPALAARDVRHSVYLDGGFWQCVQYLQGIEDLLRQELRLKAPPLGRTAEYAEELAPGDSVAIHVRRGDYVTAGPSGFGALPISYYERAVRELAHEVPALRLYVFSDDPEWTRAHLHLSHPTTVISRDVDRSACEDLWLMSRCRHHIIANSSFSWWGAWLGRTSRQIVYAPRRYYQNHDRATPDLYPAGWRLL